MSALLESVQLDLARRLMDGHPGEAARWLETASTREAAALLEREDPVRAANLLRRLTADRSAHILAVISAERARKLIGELDPLRVAPVLSRLEPEVRERLLKHLGGSLADELRSLMRYPPESAGQLMDPNVFTFRPDATAGDVIDRLREIRSRRIQDVFLADEDGKLLGSVSLQDAVLAGPGERLLPIARRDHPSVRAIAPREEVLETLEKHGVATLPVVDFDGRLIGVLRQRQLIEAAQRDASADLVTMVGASKEEGALSSPWFAVKKRLPWLEVNLLTAFLAASVVGLFESTIARFTALAVLLPVVAGQSGNTGAQALAVTMRGLALREVRTRQWMRVASKELAVGAINGVAVALTTSLAVYIWSRSAGLALVIGISMVASMIIAGLAGAVIPMGLTVLRQDPAQSSSIVLTTVTDVAGFFSFLGIATLLAGMLG